MPDEIKISRAPQAQPQWRPEPNAVQMEPKEPMRNSSSKTPWVVLVIVVLLLAAGGFVFRDNLFGNKGGQVLGASTADSYQAVFLTNGQVYFGKLTDVNGEYVTLKDIYYLQVAPQQGSGAAAAQPSPQQQISLVKLGQELHGPVDEMHISRSQILFYENLKKDGQVVKAIEQDKATKK